MNNLLYYLLILTIISLTGCTQVVTTPVSLAATAVGTTVDVAGAAGNAIVDVATSEDNEKKGG